MTTGLNPYSYLTATDRSRLSYPARLLLAAGLLQGEVLDFGCGYGQDADRLREKGIRITGYDPYYRPALPAYRFDTILCTYVLNVLLPEEQAAVLMAISSLLKPGGKAYIAVRRDQRQEGFRLHKPSRLPVYQCQVRLPYASYCCSNTCEIYEYWHYTWLHKGNAAASPFLATDTLRDLVAESATACSIREGSKILIFPKLLTSDYFELSSGEQAALWQLLNHVRAVLTEQGTGPGFDIRLHTGPDVPHAHISVSPSGI